jgi:DNA-directed RNA polymerase subunit L
MSRKTQMPYSSSSTVTDNSPKIELTSNITDDELQFTLRNVDVSIANSLRRVILSDIPIIVFKVSPNDKNKCNIMANTCGLNNEIVKHRLSCIPIHIKDLEEFPYKNYIMEVNVSNNTDTTIYVTTKDFIVKDLVIGKPLSEDKIREIFPPNDYTGDFIDFVRLKPRVAEEIQPKKLHLMCEFDIGTAKQDGAYNVVSTCSYGNTIDTAAQEAKLQQLKQKWKDEGKKESEINFEAENWKLLEGKRIFKKDSFDFVIETIGIYTNGELPILACKILLDNLHIIDTLIDKDQIKIKLSENTMKNCFDIILENYDYTIGKVLEYFLNHKFYKTGMLTFCGFKMSHPHDSYSIIRIAYKEPVEISSIKGHLKESISDSINIYENLRKEFMKLVPR